MTLFPNLSARKAAMEMKMKLFQFRHEKGIPPLFFPGPTLEEATLRAQAYLESLNMPTDNLVGKEYSLRRRKLKRKKIQRRKIKRLILAQ